MKTAVKYKIKLCVCTCDAAKKPVLPGLKYALKNYLKPFLHALPDCLHRAVLTRHDVAAQVLLLRFQQQAQYRGIARTAHHVGQLTPILGRAQARRFQKISSAISTMPGMMDVPPVSTMPDDSTPS